MLVATGRAPHPARWIPEVGAQARAAADLKNLESMF